MKIRIAQCIAVKENLQQLLMYFGMINIVYFVECMILFLRYNIFVGVIGNDGDQTDNSNSVKI